MLLFVLADRIVVVCFGEAYRDAAMALQLLAPIVILLLPISLYSYVFTALGRQRLYRLCRSLPGGQRVGGRPLHSRLQLSPEPPSAP
jgi:hypothetical protein